MEWSQKTFCDHTKAATDTETILDLKRFRIHHAINRPCCNLWLYNFYWWHYLLLAVNKFAKQSFICLTLLNIIFSSNICQVSTLVQTFSQLNQRNVISFCVSVYQYFHFTEVPRESKWSSEHILVHHTFFCRLALHFPEKLSTGLTRLWLPLLYHPFYYVNFCPLDGLVFLALWPKCVNHSLN